MMEQNEEQRLISIMGCGSDLAQREIYLLGEVNEDMGYRLIAAINQLKNTDEPIHIILNSEGGNETIGYAIYDCLMSIDNHITITGYGEVSSIASIIMQSGDVRKMSSNCDFMIHNGSIPTNEEMSQDSIIDMAEQLKKDNIKYYTILSDNSKFSIKQIQKLCEEEKSFTAAEALRVGFIDEVIETMIPKKRKIRKRRK